MEEKILKEKELKEGLLVLAKAALFIRVIPLIPGGTMLSIWKHDTALCSEVFHSYEIDPAKYTLAILREFFSTATGADLLSASR